jgi:membrane protease YdiL (CAAX protease family)
LKPTDTLVEGQASAPVQAGLSSAEVPGQRDSESLLAASYTSDGYPAEIAANAIADPAWNGWDVLRLVCLTIVALIVGVFAVLVLAHWRLYPHTSLSEIARVPLVVVAGQSLAYLLILAYMYVLVTRERHRPDFLSAIHWNWPSNIAGYVVAGFALSVGLQVLAHFLPIPKELPIDSFFRTPAEAWALSILSVTLAPLMEELFFRGFLYPVLVRGIGVPFAVFLTALSFAALHGAQLMFSWGPVLVIFLVGLVLTMVRARKNSVAAGLLIHMAYNGTITVAMFAATDGFRHLEKLNQ